MQIFQHPFWFSLFQRNYLLSDGLLKARKILLQVSQHWMIVLSYVKYKHLHLHSLWILTACVIRFSPKTEKLRIYAFSWKKSRIMCESIHCLVTVGMNWKRLDLISNKLINTNALSAYLILLVRKRMQRFIRFTAFNETWLVCVPKWVICVVCSSEWYHCTQ